MTEEPEGSIEEKHYKRIINQVSGYVREICSQMTQTIPKAIVHCMVIQVRLAGTRRACARGFFGRSGWRRRGKEGGEEEPGSPRSRLGTERGPAHVSRACDATLSISHTCRRQAKEKLLEEMQAGVAGEVEGALKRLLGEDEGIMKRREVLTHKLTMMKQAQQELTQVDV